MTPADPILTYAHEVDRLAEATARAILGDIRAALRSVRRAIERAGGADVAPARLIAQLNELAALRDALTRSVGEHLDEALVAVAETAPAVVAKSVAAAGVEISFTRIPVVQLREVIGRPHDGLGWQRWGARLADETLNRMESELRQALALGESSEKMRKRLQSVETLSTRSARVLTRTSMTSAANRATVEQSRAAGIFGFRYLATLDANTSAICQGLANQFFKANDPDLPVPPRHPNCRSHLIPVFDAETDLGASSYDAWLRRQPVAVQREALGDLRFRAWRRGVPLSGMATADRPLTAAELRARYSQEVA